MRKVVILLLFLVGAGIAVYFFRAPILTSFAQFLICEDSLQQADAIFVLSGGGYDRGNEAAAIYKQKYASKIVCTGANPMYELRVFGIDTLECNMTAINLRRHQIPDSAIVVVPQGTSTKQEATVIYNYCQKHNFKTIILVSSKLHTRRSKMVFDKENKDQQLKIVVRGAGSSRYNELTWWQTEDGLIAMNTELLKTLYYLIKY